MILRYFLLCTFFIPLSLAAQITGHVFRDVNGNGRSDKTLPAEKGAEGILVRAYVSALRDVPQGISNTSRQCYTGPGPIACRSGNDTVRRDEL